MSLERVSAIHKKCITPLQKVDAYNSIAEYYDEDFTLCGYNAPLRVAEMVNTYCGTRKETVEIMDMACGTGLLGVELAKFGFCNVDGFDPAENMLKYAKQRNVYRDICHGLLPGKLDVPEGKYDVVAISGYPNMPETLSKGFIELLRVLKIGGYMVLAIRREFYCNEAYRGTLRTTLSILEQKGNIRRVVDRVFPDYLCNVEGVILVLQKSV